MALTKIPGNLIETGAITAAALDNDAVTTAKILDANITHAKLHTSMDLTGKTVTVATAAGSTNTTAAASTAFVQQELTTLIGGAPGTLDTLNELAAAINDDSNYNSTLTTALATKLPLAGGTMTGGLTVTAGNGDQLALNNAGERFTQISLQHGGTQQGALWLDDTDSMVDLYANTSHGIRLKTGGDNPRVTILSGGNVGIGTLAPDTKLHIKQTSSGNFTEALRIENSGGGANEGNYIQWEVANTSGYGPRIGGRREGTGGVGLHFYTGEINAVPTEAMRIDHDGNVEVRDGAMLRAYRGGNSAYAGLFMDSAENLYIRNSWAQKDIVMLRTGEVGIGTALPHTKLHVSGNVKVGTAASSAWASSIQDLGGLDVVVGSGSTGFRVWDDNSQSTPRFVVKRAGNVGIGTTGPYFPLHVQGGTGFNGEAKNNILAFDTASATTGTGGGIAFGGYTNGTGGDVYHFGNIQGIKENSTAGNVSSAMLFCTRTNGATPVEQMRISSTGNVGIGTDSFAADGSSKLQVSTGSTYAWMEAWDNTSDRAPKRPICFNPWGGNVGIGTSSPYGILQVEGNTNSWGTAPMLVFSSSSTANAAVRDWAIGPADTNYGYFHINQGASTGASPLVTSNVRFTISDTGKVGIGEAVPDYMLHVKNTNTQIAIESTTTNQNSSLYYIANGANQWETGVNITAGLDYEIYDRVNNGPRMVVQHDGKIRIGNNVPMWSGAYGGALVLKGNNATSDRYAQLTIVDSSGTIAYTGLTVNNTGGVGVGTTSTASNAKLNVAGGIRFTHSSASAGGLNVVGQYSFNNSNTANACGSVYYKMFILNLYHNNGHSQALFLANGGGGVGYRFTSINAGDNTIRNGIQDFSLTTIGSAPNTFRIQISNGGGALTVSRTSGSGSFQVSVSVLAGG